MSTIADRSYGERLLDNLGDAHWLDSLRASAQQVEAVVHRLGAAGLERRYGPGKWKGKQILAHLADAELAVAFRYRQILTQQPHLVQEYDESEWVKLYGDDIDADVALASFLATRRWNLHLFARLSDAPLQRTGTHPKRGDETLLMGLKLLAGHTINHLGQLEML